MRERGQWTEQDILGLIGEVETYDLEFKQAAFLEKEPDLKLKIGKSVASIAHTAGGFLIYGIKTNSSDVAAEVTPIDETKFSKERLTELVRSQIHPRTLDFDVQRVPLKGHGEGKVAYVVALPQAREPYQTSDFKFWRRVGTTTKEMTVYEIDDVRRRKTTPQLSLSVGFKGSRNPLLKTIQFHEATAKRSKPIPLDLKIQNFASEPALFATILFRVSRDLDLEVNTGGLVRLHDEEELVEYVDDDGRQQSHFVKTFIREWSVHIGDGPIVNSFNHNLDRFPLVLWFARDQIKSRAIRYLDYEIHSPQMDLKRERFFIHQFSEDLEIKKLMNETSVA